MPPASGRLPKDRLAGDLVTCVTSGWCGRVQRTFMCFSCERGSRLATQNLFCFAKK